MHSKAKVYKHKGTPYYQAWFMVWDAKRQKWKAKTTSTRCTEEVKALEIAKEFERVALAAGGPGGATRVSRDFVVDVINDILRISGHREVEDTKLWQPYAEAWLAGMKLRVPENLGLGTWQNYKASIKQFTNWLGKEASIPLGAITGDMMQKWYRAGISEGLSAATMNNATTTLSSIFERARDEGFAKRNPVNLIDREENGGNTREPFTPADMEALLTYLRSDPERKDWLTVTLLGLCTSQRLTDCSNALKTQIEQGSPFWIWNMVQRKTGKRLRIPLVEPVLSHIKAVMAEGSDSLFLAPSLAGLPTGTKEGLSAQFGVILEACDVQGKKVQGTGKGRSFHSKTFHSTRHTCNSLLANAGIPKDVRILITGHAADDATNLIYTHLDDSTKAKALTKAFKASTAKKSG